MSEHPAKGCTKYQREVFEQIAVGNDGGHYPKTLEILERKGLIVGENVVLGGRFPVIVRRYHVPLDLHSQWCRWCGQHTPRQSGEGE